MMTPRRLRTSTKGCDAREAVLDRLAERYEYFAVKEQEHRGNGKSAEAEGAHRYPQWILRAYQAEAGQ